MDYFNKEQSEIFKLDIDNTAKNSFLEMSRWTKFLAVVGFVMLGLLLVVGIFFGIFLPTFLENYGSGNSAMAGMGPLMSIVFIVLFIIIVGVYFYPTYALLKYSTQIKNALLTDNKEQFNSAIRYLKNMFKYLGILMIVMLSLYGLQLIFLAIGVVGR